MHRIIAYTVLQHYDHTARTAYSYLLYGELTQLGTLGYGFNTI